MGFFKITTHLSKILEDSEKEPVMIFKYSSTCASSDRLRDELISNIKNEKIKTPIYQITVQEQKNLSKNIEDMLGVQHESPQIIILDNRKVTYTKSHHFIKIEDLITV